VNEIYHVIPENDSHEHETTMDCFCEPVLKDGVVVHNSYDGREYFEGDIKDV